MATTNVTPTDGELAFMLFNALVTVGAVYLASYTGLNRWRSLQTYDRVFKSSDSPRTFEDIPALTTGEAKRLSRRILIIGIALGSFLLLMLGSLIYAGVTRGWERLFNQLLFWFLIPYFAWGFSALDHTLPTTVESLRRVRFGDELEPSFITTPRKWWQSVIVGAVYILLGIHTALSGNVWFATVAVSGVVFLYASKSFRSNTCISVRGMVLALFSFVLALSLIVLAILNITAKNGDSSSGPSVDSTTSNYLGLQFSICFAAALSTLVLRAEWAAAEKATDTHARGQFEVRFAEKEALQEKVPEATTQSALEPVVTSARTRTDPAIPAAQEPVETRAIRVPPLDLFHLNKDAAKAIGKLEPFASPVFNTLMLTTLLTYLPGILISASLSPLSSLVPFSPTLARLTDKYFLVVVLWVFPPPFLGLLVQPAVLMTVLGLRWNKGGREIWRYSERWSRELPKVEQPETMVASSTPTAPSLEPENQSEY